MFLEILKMNMHANSLNAIKVKREEKAEVLPSAFEKKRFFNKKIE